MKSAEGGVRAELPNSEGHYRFQFRPALVMTFGDSVSLVLDWTDAIVAFSRPALITAEVAARYWLGDGRRIRSTAVRASAPA